MAKQTKSYHHHYPSDLTDEQWAALAPLLELADDEPARTYQVRDIIDAIFYLNRTGCAWRYLPENLPPWQNVQYYFYKWTKNKRWEQINTTLRKRVRRKVGKKPDASAGIIDAQSVKTTEEKGGAVVMMPASELKVVNDTYSLIRSV
jgi:transposase